jgi:hypothetical protein
MASPKKHMCPVFPDMICPQGEAMSNACSVRINGDFDPMSDFRDYLLVHCAIYQSQEHNKSGELSKADLEK